MVSLVPLSVAMYSFGFLKIHGQDRAVYFSAVPSVDWPRGVDARSSSPRHRASAEAGGDSLADLNDEDEDERTSYAYEKLQGKWPAGEELSSKRRKMIGLSHREERLVSIGATI